MLTNTTSLILTAAQAEVIYSAMCALNNVSARLLCNHPDGWSAFEDVSGAVFVVKRAAVAERYDNQTDFATAYGLDHGGEPQSAVAAAAGGLTQTAVER